MIAAAFVILAMLPIAPAQAWFPRGGVTAAPPASCPYGTGAGDNGCAAAPANGTIDTGLLVSAQQSGQNSLLPLHSNPANGIFPFNLPKVDYGVGPNTTLTPQDPRTINDDVCQWASTFLNCSSTGSGVVHKVYDNYDFGGTKIGQPAAGVFAVNNHVAAGSDITFTNSYFSLIPTAGSSAILFGGNINTVFFNSSKCDGTSAISTSGFCFSSSGTASGTLSIDYSDFTNQGVGRIANGLTNIAFIVKHSYIDGLNSLNTSNHGELMLRNCTGARKNCTAADDYEGLFIVWPPGTVAGVNNATIFPGDGSSDGVTLSSVKFQKSVIVTNSLTGGNGVINQAIFNSRLSSMGDVDLSDLWVDASGADGCSISGVKSGGSSVTASQSGTVVTITGLSSSFGNNPIEKNWQFWRGGNLWATITSLGTSVGNTGTVNVDVSATVPSDSSWTLVPGFTSQTANNNYSLADPGHTGVPVALNISGPQFTAAACPPH